MSKTIIINEKMLNSPLLKEGILLNTLPDDIKDDDVYRAIINSSINISALIIITK